MQIDVTVTRPDPLDPAKMRQALLVGVNRIMLLALRAAKLRAPNQMGRLVTSLTTSVTPSGDGVQGVLGTDVRYARYVEEGTAPHLIRPRNAKALSWLGRRVTGARLVSTRRGSVLAGGRLRTTSRIFARVVHHPGTAARPFLRAGLEEVLPEIPRILVAEIRAALGQAGGA